MFGGCASPLKWPKRPKIRYPHFGKYFIFYLSYDYYDYGTLTDYVVLTDLPKIVSIGNIFFYNLKNKFFKIFFGY